MDDFTRKFFEESNRILGELNKGFNTFFEEEIKAEPDKPADLDMLKRYKPIHEHVIATLEGEIRKISAVEAMGLGADESVNTEEEKELYISIIRNLEMVKQKLELVLYFFIDNLGHEAVKEVLDGE